MRTVLNELVRDGIPASLKRKKIKHKIRTASEDEFRRKLEEKLHKEVVEFTRTRSIEGLAEIMEVILAIAEVDSLSPEDFTSCIKSLRELSLSIGSSPATLELCRQKKSADSGAFLKRIILEFTESV
jgi:predicted house-cleaning noncanonical NTP pyrophosphatase (MazG superfamily)